MTLEEIQIDRLALEGDGVGRLISPGRRKGQVAFVPYSLPNETLWGDLLTQKKNYSRWLPQKIEKTSPERVTPPCPTHFKPGHSQPWCGGCDWQHQRISFQQQAKQELLRETLERLGGFSNPPVGETLFGPEEWRYRNKVQVPFGHQGNHVISGFFAPGTHTLVEFKDCLIQPTSSVKIVRVVTALANKFHWHPYKEDRHEGWLRHLLIRTNQADQAMVVLVTSDQFFRDKNRFIEALRKECPFVIGVHQNVQKARTHVILGDKWIPLWGENRIGEEMNGFRLEYSPRSFFQVNSKAAEVLYNKVMEELKPSRDYVVVDLFCGVGAMTLMGALRAKFALGVESLPAAIKDARHNAKINGIKNVEFVEEDVERIFFGRGSGWEERLKLERVLVVLDPPRSGCPPLVLRSILNLKPERIVYVSCHPATLARDLKVLAPFYKLGSVTPVDLFPQTSHIESISLLERESPLESERI